MDRDEIVKIKTNKGKVANAVKETSPGNAEDEVLESQLIAAFHFLSVEFGFLSIKPLFVRFSRRGPQRRFLL